MPQHRKTAKQPRLHAAIVAEAARLLARGDAAGIEAARRKACDRLGIARGQPGPSDEEIRAGLAEYLVLFAQTPQQQRRLRMLAAAGEAMRFLAEFEPQLLVDAVDEASQDADAVELLVFADDPDALPRWLDEHGIGHDLVRRRLYPAGAGPSEAFAVDAATFTAGDTGFLLLPLPTTWLRRPLARSPRREPTRRLGEADVSRLLASARDG